MNPVDAVKQVLLQSGASWVLWLLGVLSLASVAIAVERWFFYRARGPFHNALFFCFTLKDDRTGRIDY